MTDRELLELAAKAAGIAGTVTEDRSPVLLTAEWGIWNPLNSDGDALRLAVKLGLNMHIFTYSKVTFVGECEPEIGTGADTEEEHNSDPCAATRRAIVRAAAEIGKEMK